MSLEIVTGRSKSGKSEYVYQKISKLVENGEKVILIVPEQFSHSAEKRLLSYINSISENSAEVYSFNHLASVVESALGYSCVNKLDAVGKSVIISDILKNNELTFYKNAYNQKGFVDLASSVIGEFKKYMLLPETLEIIADKTDDKVLSMKLKDLTVVYKEFEKKIAKEYRDGDDLLTILSERIENNDIFNDRYVFFDGFSTFIPQEIKVIEVICKKCREVCVTLCMDKEETNSTLFMPTLDTFRTLCRISSSVKHTVLKDTHFKSEALSFLEKQLYNFPGRQYDKNNEDIKIFSLANPLNEVEICAGQINKLIRECGYKFKDIGVVCSDIGSYERHIERIFTHASLEYFIDNKNDIINHHLIQFVLGLLLIYINNYNFNDIFNYLKDCFVTADASTIALLERFIQNSNIRRSSWLDDEKWNSILEASFSDNNYLKDSFNNIRDKYIKPLSCMHESMKGRHTVRHNATVLFDFINNLKMPDTIGEYIQKFTDEGQQRLSEEYEKIWGIIVDTLDKVVYLCGDNKVNVQEFYDLLYTAFSQQQIGFIPLTVDRILVGNTERTRFENIKVLFVLGVNEGVFPVSSKPDGVLSDSDKEAMKNHGVEFSTTSSIAAYYSQFCAYTAFTMPSEKLYVSYSKSGNDYKTLRKSYIIDRILKMFSLKEVSEVSIPEKDKLINKSISKELLADKVAEFRLGAQIDDIWTDVYNCFNEKTDFCDLLEKFAKSNNLFSSLSQKNIEKLVSMLSYTSVSKIERYMACKYAYFIDYILRIENEKEDFVDALDIGNITHNVLESLCREFGQTREGFVNTPDELVYNRISQLINNYIDDLLKHKAEISNRDRYTLNRLSGSIYLCFEAIKNQFANSSFEPLGYEIEFNPDSDLGAIEINTSEGRKVELTGKIDRADIYTSDGVSYVRVVDYKTGNKEFKLDDVLYGLSVQLMVYLNKLVASDKNYSYGGALYFPVSDVLLETKSHSFSEDVMSEIHKSLRFKGIVPYDDKVLSGYDEQFASSLGRAHKDKRLSLENFETIDVYLKSIIGDICDNMLGGNFEISPSQKNDNVPCKYCKYNSICRFDSSSPGNNYNHYKTVNGYDEIIKEMEERVGECNKNDVDSGTGKSN